METYAAEHFHEDCISLTLPHLIDKLAERIPNRVFVSLLKENIADGYRDYSYRDFARAIDKCAWWIDATIGRSAGFDTVAYVGSQDLRYAILVLAATKTGHKLQCFHPALSIDSYLHLLRATGCKILFFSPSTPVAEQIIRSANLPVFSVPSLSIWLDSPPVSPYIHRVPVSSSSHEPFTVLHTSGTTGHPKPVTLTHASYNLHYASYSHILISSNADEGTVFAHFRNLRVLVTTPISVAAGLYAILGYNIVHDFVPVLPPPWTAISADFFNTCLTHADIQASITAPRHFREVARTPQYLANISRLRYLAYIGAPCPADAGPVLSSRTRLTPLYGTTESGVYPLFLSDAEDWAYIRPHPMLSHDFRHVCHDLYEIVLTRRRRRRDEDSRSSSSSTAFQTVFRNFPHLAEYPVQDLFSPHAEERHTWRYRGRKEDLTRTSDGELFLPKQMEGIIDAQAVVGGAIICDLGPPKKKQGLACVVELGTEGFVEGNDDEEEEEERQKNSKKKEIEEKIWAAVQMANAACPVPGGAKVRRELLLLVEKGSMPRGTKGYPVRNLVLEKFRQDIQALYQKLPCRNPDESPPPPSAVVRGGGGGCWSNL
ncbi:MAG: hypothetical protein Q9191_004827 [Dirinaria sp. TL-2023a]